LRCFRPQPDCYCDAIPKIDNQTEILIIQHVRERDHPFNTARMVNLALAKSQIICGNNQSLKQTEFQLRPKAGLLYPSATSKTLATLPPEQRPEQLVLIDGTWPQARTMIRELTQLRGLPHYKLAPSQPGQYRIRLEPNDTSLSTVEAAVQALQELEPNLAGLDQLIHAFEKMVQRQLDHPKVGREHYSGGPKSGGTFNVPARLLEDPNSIVVAYGEAAFRENIDVENDPRIAAGRTLRQLRNAPRPPLFWVAQRLGTGEVFSQSLTPGEALTDSFLQHLELSRQQFEHSVEPVEFRRRWRAFLKPDDLLVVFNQGTIGLLENSRADICSSLTLKSINFDRGKLASVSDSSASRSIQPRQDPEPSLTNRGLGRAGKRLANSVDLVWSMRRHARANA
jgi:DTW domain-containing protein YfiP